MNCPFCRSSNNIPICNSQGTHWIFCAACKASGPQLDNAEAAAQAFANASPSKEPGVIARLMGRG